MEPQAAATVQAPLVDVSKRNQPWLKRKKGGYRGPFNYQKWTTPFFQQQPPTQTLDGFTPGSPHPDLPAKIRSAIPSWIQIGKGIGVSTTTPREVSPLSSVVQESTFFGPFYPRKQKRSLLRREKRIFSIQALLEEVILNDVEAHLDNPIKECLLKSLSFIP